MDLCLKNILSENASIVHLHNTDLSFINEQQIKVLKEKEGIKIFEINKSKKVVDKNGLLEELYIKGEFGGHFGFNWDALNDCLTEYDTVKLKVILFLYYYYKDINRNDLEIFLRIFSTASERYKEQDVVLKLILVE